MNAATPWLRTSASGVWTLQRLALAAVAFPIGAQSGVPSNAPVSVMIASGVCAVLLALGLATRVAAVVVSAILLAVLMTGQGLAVPLLGLALSLSLLARGGGAGSVDRVITRKWHTLSLEQEITTDGLIVGRRVGQYGE